MNDILDKLKEESQIVPALSIGKNWYWIKYDDGSGCLLSPNRDIYMHYDLETNEYQEKESSDWEFFPLSYYYADGIAPKDFKPFEWMEEHFIENVLKKENEVEL